MPLAPKDLHATWRGVNSNWIHDCQNGKMGRLDCPEWQTLAILSRQALIHDP